MNLVEEFHEFTWDMIRALPKAYYLHSRGTPVEVHCKPGLSELYYFADKIVELDKFHGYNDSISYNNEAPDYALKEWLPPPLKERFKGKVAFTKPTVVIQNKYALEWLTGVYNYFPTEVLGELFDYLKEDYDIIYIRPKGNTKNYYQDENEIKPFKDYEFIEEYHPYVYTIDKFINQYPELSYNTLQMLLQSTSDKHITVSGGNACLSAYFGGDVFIFDSPEGKGAGRGVWKDNSWLSMLGGANIFGFNDYATLIDKVKLNW
jgi:hypothetical protein